MSKSTVRKLWAIITHSSDGIKFRTHRCGFRWYGNTIRGDELIDWLSRQSIDLDISPIEAASLFIEYDMLRPMVLANGKPSTDFHLEELYRPNTGDLSRLLNDRSSPISPDIGSRPTCDDRLDAIRGPDTADDGCSKYGTEYLQLVESSLVKKYASFLGGVSSELLEQMTAHIRAVVGSKQLLRLQFIDEPHTTSEPRLQLHASSVQVPCSVKCNREAPLEIDNPRIVVYVHQSDLDCSIAARLSSESISQADVLISSVRVAAEAIKRFTELNENILIVDGLSQSSFRDLRKAMDLRRTVWNHETEPKMNNQFWCEKCIYKSDKCILFSNTRNRVFSTLLFINANRCRHEVEGLRCLCSLLTCAYCNAESEYELIYRPWHHPPSKLPGRLWWTDNNNNNDDDDYEKSGLPVSCSPMVTLNSAFSCEGDHFLRSSIRSYVAFDRHGLWGGADSLRPRACSGRKHTDQHRPNCSARRSSSEPDHREDHENFQLCSPFEPSTRQFIVVSLCFYCKKVDHRRVTPFTWRTITLPYHRYTDDSCCPAMMSSIDIARLHRLLTTLMLETGETCQLCGSTPFDDQHRIVIAHDKHQLTFKIEDVIDEVSRGGIVATGSYLTWFQCQVCNHSSNVKILQERALQMSAGMFLELMFHCDCFPPPIGFVCKCGPGRTCYGNHQMCFGIIGSHIVTISRVPITLRTLNVCSSLDRLVGSDACVPSMRETDQSDDTVTSHPNRSKPVLIEQFILTRGESLNQWRNFMAAVQPCDENVQVVFKRINNWLDRISSMTIDAFTEVLEADKPNVAVMFICNIASNHNEILDEVTEVCSQQSDEIASGQQVRRSMNDICKATCTYIPIPFNVEPAGQSESDEGRSQATLVVARSLTLDQYKTKLKQMWNHWQSSTSGPQSVTGGRTEHIDVKYSEDSINYTCRVYNACTFHRLRSAMGITGESLARSLSKSYSWCPTGGKSKVRFRKTCDKRFCVKQLTKVELEFLIDFAKAYTDYVGECIEQNRLCLLAKVVGAFRTSLHDTSESMLSSNNNKVDFVVIENVFQECNPSMIFDLKGSKRNRFAHIDSPGARADDKDPSLRHNVGLDENFTTYILNQPLYADVFSHRLVLEAVEADTAFLSKHSVMDYSLLLGISKPDAGDKREMALRQLPDNTCDVITMGIIDYLRPFTWDKKVEMLVKKTTSVLNTSPVKSFTATVQEESGSKSVALQDSVNNEMSDIKDSRSPTIIDPASYRNRLVRYVKRSFIMVPGCMHAIESHYLENILTQREKQIDATLG